MNILVKRFIATAIDIGICLIPAFLLQLLLNFLCKNMQVGMPEMIDTWFHGDAAFVVIYTLYQTFYESVFGKTIGKNSMKLYTNYTGEEEFSLARSFIRAITKSLGLTILYGIPAVLSVLYMCFDLSSSFHDRLVGTIVCEK